MRKLIFATAAGAASLAMLGLASTSQAALVYALTDTNSIISFDTAAPTTILSGVALQTGSSTAMQDLIGIDYRPANNLLYGVGRLGGVYTINPTTGVATQVSQLSTTLNGSRFGLDFNPVPDRLRITSDADQNLRVDVTTGTTTVDSPLNSILGNPNIIGSAYTNNDNDITTGTTLYAIDSVTDALFVQNPPNNGTLSFVGPLGFDVSSLSGFDIQVGTNTGFAALQLASNGVSSFYRIDLLTGVATPLGVIGGGDFIDGIAVTIPEPTTLGLLGGAVALLLRRRAR